MICQLPIAIADTGYVCMPNVMLPSYCNGFVALDIVPEKVAMLNRRQSPIEGVETGNFFTSLAQAYRDFQCMSA